MDEKDKQILNMIRNDARMSYQEIGDKLGMRQVREVIVDVDGGRDKI